MTLCRDRAVDDPVDLAQKNLASTVSRNERQDLSEWKGTELSVTHQADLLAVHRGTLSYQPMAPSPKEVALKHRIDAISTETPVYGYRRITAQLHREGWEVHRKTIARYRGELRLVGIHPGPNLSKRDHAAGISPYLLRHITASYPDHVGGGGYYVCQGAPQLGISGGSA